LSERGIDDTAYLFSDKVCQYAVYKSVQQFTTQITIDAKLKIVDAPLTRIFMLGQGACRQYFGP
jgi:hypothetical protein